LSIGGGFSLLALAWQWLPRRPLAGGPVEPSSSLSTSQYATLRKAAAALLGDARRGDIAADGLDRFLAGAGYQQAADLGLALTVLDLFPYGFLRPARFARLTDTEAAAVLTSWSRSGSAIRRQIGKALREAVRFTWFGREETWAEMGYDGPWVPR
jgi:hypothetical protein